MLQARKSHSCGISAIFFQCCFMIETQVLMTVSDFWRFFLGIIPWKGPSRFNGVFVFQMGDFIFSGGWCLMGWHWFLWEVFKKILGWRVTPHTPLPRPPDYLWETLIILFYSSTYICKFNKFNN